MQGTNAVAAAQEMIRDRIKYLMVEKGLASYQLIAGTALLRVWKEQPTSKALKAAAQNAKEGTDAQLKEIISRAERLDNTLKTIGQERPEFMEPFIMAYEYSDGNIDTLSKLNRYFEESLPTLLPKFCLTLTQRFLTNWFKVLGLTFTTLYLLLFPLRLKLDLVTPP